MATGVRAVLRAVATSALVFLLTAATGVAAPRTAPLSRAVGASVTLTATALIVPGTGTPDPAGVAGYMSNAVDYYIAPTTESCAVQCIPRPVPYIAQFWPFPWPGWGGLTGAKLDVSVASGLAQLTSDLVGEYRPSAGDPVVIFGYSQGATVASRQKTLLSRLSAEEQSTVSFVLIGNPNRPNGGLFERLAPFGTVPVLDATFGLPTPTDTGMATTDIAFQYDGIADFPLYPANLLATLNAIAGFWYFHGSMLSPNGRYPDDLPNGMTPGELAAAIADPANRQRVPGSDTTYVLVPTPNLPLLQPLREFGAATGLESITSGLIDLVQPALRAVIETGYDRSLPYSRPSPLRLLPLPPSSPVSRPAARGPGGTTRAIAPRTPKARAHPGSSPGPAVRASRTAPGTPPGRSAPGL